MEGCGYEVFLSFRAPDTRAGFTDFLYTYLIDKGVRTFKDEEDLRPGEEIGPELLGVIEQSKICIPIFSRGYASSRWCLRELAQMVECRKRKGQVIMPIFYDVKPSEVRHQTGGYGEALHMHKNNKRVDNETIHKWRAALREVSMLKGLDMQNTAIRREGQIVKMVVTEVLSELNKAHLVVSDFLVGVEDSVEEVLWMIGTDTNEVKTVGIHGIGGIGKSTLAKVVYNKLSRDFAHHCFLADVRETSRSKGIVFLQTQLISNLSKMAHPSINCMDEGIRTIEERFSSKKVLILLDDVDEKNQLIALLGRQSCFGPGSRILITTRKVNVLREFGVKLTYLVGGLDPKRSLKLFSKHVFRRVYPPIEKMEQSREIVKIAQGHPLSLIIMGSTLSMCGQIEEMWEDYLVKWKKGHIDDLRSKLMISYAALDPNQRQIFLDIACLFDGYDKSTVMYMWRDSGLCPTEGLEVLQLMSLIKIGEDNKLWMHNQFKDFGREIVSQESGGELDQQSRLWNHNDALEILQRKKGTSKIEALRLDECGCKSYTSEQFKELTNLRFLYVNGANFTGDFQNLLPQLRWLQWERCPLEFTVANFHPKKLVVLNLSWSEISEDWRGWGPLKMATKLKVLNLSHFHYLKRIPDLSALKSLEILILEDCQNLEEIHPSIGDIKTLISLDVSSCGRLAELPTGVGRMEELRVLLLDHTAIQDIPISRGCLMKLETLRARGCSQLAQLPNSIGSLVSLTQLDLSFLGIEELSESIGSLKNLETLDASNCALLANIPSSIGHLASLTLLNLSCCPKLAHLPDSIGFLVSLTWLDLSFSGMKELPESIGHLKNLETLDASNCASLAHIPSSIGYLASLSLLNLSYCPKLAQLPYSIGSLMSLQHLLLEGCLSLREIPESIEKMASLTKLDLKSTKIAELPESIGKMQNLRILDIRGTQITELLSATNLQSCVKESHLETTPLKMPREVRGPSILLPRETMKKMEDEAREQAADMETSDRNYAIAAVQNVVGIDHRAKQITDLLEMEVNDEVRIIGIYGTDGIGKTTLAKAVYKRISSCFDSCSFLAEVDETKQNHPRGIEFLQTKLIRDILKRDCEDPSFDERIKDFLDIFRETKVLIVVDDVEEQSHLHAIVGDQLHWFGPGSRIIVTSKNSEILKGYDLEKARTYLVSELDDGQAFELFCKHAFRMQSSVPDYDGLSYHIVNATEKLPLAVEVVGSFLRGKSIPEWKKMEKSMKERMRSSKKTTIGLEEILDICYKELDQQQKDIFLDIAGFISGVDARIVSYMLPNSYLPSSGSILMPLAKIGDDNELQMHRLLRCLGKRIFKQGESGDPIGRKFYIQDGVPKAISRKKGMENVEALSFDFTAGDFQSMPNIRFLKLDNAKVSGNFEGAFASLRWLCWQRCPLEFDAFNFVLGELVILDLSWSKVTEDWGGWRKIKMEKLKVLNLTGCSDLLITPKFSDYKDLEILILERCSRLVKLDPSIGHLKRLVSLNLKSCSQLNRLPVELGHMTALEELFIDGTSVREIPISIGNLKQLKIFSGFKCFPLTYLPSSISYLTALSKLSLDGAKITKLPTSLGELSNLRRLSLRDCRYMVELPDSIGKMGSLEELDISATSISRLPNSIRNLESLRVLRMDSSFIRAFPGEIGNLTKLEELHASWCRSLKGVIPGDIKGLRHLRSLTLGHSSISSLPPEISTISGLHTLDLIHCNEIEELPKLPPSLNCLRLSSKNMKVIPSLEDLKELEELYLSDGDQEAHRPSSKQPMPESNVKQMIDKQSFSILLPRLRKLELSLSQVIKLKFELTDIPRLKRRETLTLPGLSHKEVFEHPKTLSVFKLYHSAIEEIEGLEGLEALKRLDISNCKIQNLNGIGQLNSLRSLVLSDCDDLSSLDLSNLKSLKVLEIRRCKMIHQIEGLEKLTSLEKLNISECPAENSVEVENALKDVMARSVEIWGGGDSIKQGATSSKCNYREEILPDTSNKRMEKMKDVAGQRAADVETSDRNYAIAAAQNVVGIDDHAKYISDLLEMEVNDEVRIVGIYGTDGIGKTTLAKAVYDRISYRFNCCSFLTEVEETMQNASGIQFLQTKLIRNILKQDREDPSFDERIEDFLDIFRAWKVLIVVDDVEEPSHLHAIVGDQLHWFGPGSRIIVTSQNEKILKGYDPEKARTCTVSELDDGQAFELFCKHAFGIQTSIPDYDGLSNRIVNATVKLPLAVEVVGSFLRGKPIQEWLKMEESMKAQTMSSQKTTVGLEEILDICYQELDEQQKDIFLDIAGFVSGVDARIASYMWPNRHLPSSDCILMPLAKVGENNELQMHRLLRCLGKRILNQKGTGDPIGRKFYIQDMVPKAISRETGMENVKALCFNLDVHASCTLIHGDFETMPDIRFLKLDNAKLSGDFAGAFASLRWFCWQRCPPDFDAINLVLGEVVVLDLSGSKFTEDWGGWSTIKMEKLKVLNLTGCSDLLFTPDFSGYKDLEILILERCSRLVKLHPSIGHLKRLVSLNLKSCPQLNGLPVELGRLTALEELFIDGTSVREIPISIGNLKQLKILSGLECFPLTHLPSSICYLTALSVLSLNGAKISELPSSLGELLNLRRLSLRDCHYMQELPDSIGKMGSSLEELDISATSISKLPNSIRNLQSLRVLRMDSSFIRAFPLEIGNLTKLEELHASWCRSLKGTIPRDIKSLHYLRSLTLEHSSISSLPSEISTISSLQTLDLLQCNEIEVLPDLPPSLICLRVSSKRMKAIPLLKDLKELEELCLSDEDPMERQPPSKQLMPESKVKQLSIWFSRLRNLELLQTPRVEEQSFSISFPKLRKLELSLSRIIKLQFVYEPKDIPQLKTLTLSGLSLEEVSELPRTLSVLSIRGCSSLKRLPTVQCLTNISSFELYHSAIEEIEGLEGLKSLKRLDITNCKIQNLNGIGQLTSLRGLILSDCDYLSLPDLSDLKSLKVLEIRRCKMIHQIEGLEKLTSLEKLNISECLAENSVQVVNVMARLMVT